MGIAADAGHLQTLIDGVVFTDAKQDDQSSQVLCANYDKIIFFVDITAAGAADASIEMQVYLQVSDGTNWFDVVDAPFASLEYDHSQVINAPRPGTSQLRECFSWDVSADNFRIDVQSAETTAAKTLTVTISALGLL